MAIDTAALFARYHAAWEAKDPARIASLHSEDSGFILHDGSARVHGRAALEADFAELFRKLPGFGFEMRRTIFGERHWVFEWAMTMPLPGGGSASVDLLDVVDVNDAGEVTRKDVYINGAQQAAFYARMEAAAA
ncbi:nuclear transport factor 2 family protein [Phenylobacterium sp.]|uniref:nuclear transport factor 2 family protein n=1 Tax=Phenylobacterium sp. TaxID=1871053 RepID=UPI0025D679C8|nr:nuclear transport factor 2 family protein [Phenylobacterium sp.]